MKRLKLSVLMLLSVFLLSACGEQADIRSAADLSAPEEAADLMMESLKGLNLDLFNEYTDNYVGSERNWLGITVRKEYQVFNELLQPFHRNRKRYRINRQFSEKLMENLSWEITDVRKDEEQAQIDMEITNIDMQKVMGNYTVSLLEENMRAGQENGLWGMIRGFGRLIHSAVSVENLASAIEQTDPDNPDNQSTISVTLIARPENGVWKFQLNEDFINAFMGNINSDTFPEEIEQRINELTLQYEQTLSRSAGRLTVRKGQPDGWPVPVTGTPCYQTDCSGVSCGRNS